MMTIRPKLVSGRYHLRLQTFFGPRRPRSLPNYPLQAVLEFARDQGRSKERRMKKDEIDALMDISDGAVDKTCPFGPSHLQVLRRVLQDLPQPRRSIFVAALVHEIPSRAIAKYYGVSVCKIDLEIQRALQLGAIYTQRH